jgi:uncharacterized protein YecA (UPF0149 family)
MSGMTSPKETGEHDLDHVHGEHCSHGPTRKPIVLNKVGRNDPCPCGSGKKHKKCCGAAPAR